MCACLPDACRPFFLQYDVHLPLLTVRETLAFAHDALWAAGCKNDLAAEFAQVGGQHRIIITTAAPPHDQPAGKAGQVRPPPWYPGCSLLPAAPGVLCRF